MTTPHWIYPSLLLVLGLHITVQPAEANDSEDSLIPATEALESDLEWWTEYSQEVRALSPTAQFEMGQKVVDFYLKDSLEENPDPQVLARLENLVQNVLDQTGRSGLSPTIHISKDKRLNAFVTHGAHVMFTQGMIDQFTDDELAYVVGHELAHLLMGHLSRDWGQRQVQAEIMNIEDYLNEQLRAEARYSAPKIDSEAAESNTDEASGSEPDLSEANSSTTSDEEPPAPPHDEAAEATTVVAEAESDEPTLRVVVEIDADGDGLDDRDEVEILGTQPNEFDTDRDGLSDGVEVLTTQTNPLFADTDGDEIDDGMEVNRYFTDPLLADTDGGGALDSWELGVDGTDPMVPDDDLTEVQHTILLTRKETLGRLNGLSQGLSSQYDELEADLYGMFWASAAGYPIASAYSVHSKLLATEVDAADTYRTWGERHGTINSPEDPRSSHPTAPRRMQQIRNADLVLKHYHGLFTAGQQLCDGGSTEVGVGAYERYLSLFSADGNGQTNLGLCLLEDLLDDCAATGMKEVLPRTVDNRIVMRGSDSYSSPFDNPEWVRSWRKARLAFDNAMAVDRSNHVALAALGLMARHEKKDAEALQLLDQALILAPEGSGQIAGIQNNRGTILASMGNIEDAKDAFSKATLVDPSLTVAWENWRTVVVGEGKKRPVKKFDKFRQAHAKAAPIAGSAPRFDVADFQGLRPSTSKDAIVELLGEPDTRNPVQAMSEQFRWHDLDAEKYEGPELVAYIRGDHVTSLILDLRDIGNAQSWALSNGLHAGMSREKVVDLMGLPSGGEFTSNDASFRLAYVYSDQGLRVLFDDQWKVSQIMLVPNEEEAETLNESLAEMQAKMEARTQSINDICTHLNDRFGYPESDLPRCVNWIQDVVASRYDESQMESFKTCTLAIETNVSSEVEHEIGQCACAVDPDNPFMCEE